MAEKDSTFNWWKKVVERRKGREGPQKEGPAKGAAEAGDPEVLSGETIPPVPKPPPATPPLEELVDQVINGKEPGPDSTPPGEPVSEGADQPGAAPPKAGRDTLPPPGQEKPPKPGPPARARRDSSFAPEPTRRSGRLPKDLLACLILVDIGGEMRDVRKIPSFFPLQRLNTLTGRHAKAHIHLDDAATIRPEHARIIGQDKGGRFEFSLYPQSGGEVTVAGRPVSEKGVVLENGDLITIGSAKLVFFMKDLRETDS